MSSKSDRFKEELEQTQMLRTMIIESDEEEPSILEEIEEFEEITLDKFVDIVDDRFFSFFIIII